MNFENFIKIEEFSDSLDCVFDLQNLFFYLRRDIYNFTNYPQNFGILRQFYQNRRSFYSPDCLSDL